MTFEDFSAWLAEFVSADAAAWTPESQLVADLGLDSIAIVEVVIRIEAEFDVTLPEELLESITTLGELHGWYEKFSESAIRIKGAGPSRASGSSVHLGGRHTSLRLVDPSDYGFLSDISRRGDRLVKYRGRGVTHRPEQFVEYLWNDVLCQFVVHRKSDAAPLGLISCYRPDFTAGHAHFSIVMADPSPMAGWQLEGLVLFLNYVFEVFPLRKLYVEISEFNEHQLSHVLANYLDTEIILVEHEYLLGRWWDLRFASLSRTRFDEASRVLLESVG